MQPLVSMKESLDRYRAIQMQREDSRRKVTADRWDKVKAWLGVFGFVLAIPTLGLAVANFYYNIVLRKEHLGLVVTRIPKVSIDPDTKLLSTSDLFEGTFINGGSRPLAVQGIYLELSVHSALTAWDNADCVDHHQSFKALGGRFIIKDKDVIQQQLQLWEFDGWSTNDIQTERKSLQDHRSGLNRAHVDVLSCIRVWYISPTGGNMAISIPIQRVTYNNGQVIATTEPPYADGEIDLWTYSDTIFGSK